MDISGTITDILVFAGGYDTDQDAATSRLDDDEGNAIYIISASDGTLLRTISDTGPSLSIADMDNGIAGDILPIDINSNGITNRLYASDIGGRIIRIDIPDGDFSSTTLTRGIIADINTNTLDYRRFFNTPEIGYFNRGGYQYLAIMLGTGNRPSPPDNVITDRFDMIKDPAVWTAPSTYVTVANADLFDTTDNIIQDGSTSNQIQPRQDILTASGWFIDFRTAEKSFSKAILYNYSVLFATYSAVRSTDLATYKARGANGVSRFYRHLSR